MSVMILGAFLIALVVAIFGVGVFIRNRKQESTQMEGESEHMVKHLYYYLVLFATLMMSIGGSVGVFMSVADYVSPNSYYQSFTDYKMMTEKEAAPDSTPKTEEELKKSYEEMVENEKQRIKDNALNGIIKSFGWIIIPLPVFFYFQRQIRRKENH
ncbi:hypothetical protein [Ectobacillus funiculus]|uniref:hypothetical protein n=1 Tax=Ectobacillus funiculus TaxID=137993 RepID=UPI00101B8CC6|nr:hypothetical protein [Ectobacillus funiculus]